MNASDILNSKYPSPTTFIGVISNPTTTTYTPTVPMEVVLNVGEGTGSLNVNGGSIAIVRAQTFAVPVGAGQTLTISSSGLGGVVSARRIS